MEKTKKMLELEERLGEDLGEYLRREYINKGDSIKYIANYLRIGETTVGRLLRKYKIATRRGSEAKLPIGFVKPTKEQLEKRYVKERKTPKQIAEEIGAGQSTIIRWLKKEGIPIRNISEAKLPLGVPKPTQKQLHEWCINKRNTAYQIAKKIDVSTTTIYKWLRAYSIPIRKSS